MTNEEKKRKRIWKGVSDQEKQISKSAKESGELEKIVFKPDTPEDKKKVATLQLSDSIGEAFKEVCRYEIGDKTNLLFIIFCIIWQGH